MPGTVKSELLPDADRLHKCDGQEKVCEIQHLPLDKSHFITVYSFGAIFGKITVIEPSKISRSISNRVDYPPIRLSCFGIISVSVRQFSPVSFLPWISQRRIAPFGTLILVRIPPHPCQKSWHYIAGEAYPTQAGHSIGIIHRWTTCIIEHFCALCRMSTK